MVPVEIVNGGFHEAQVQDHGRQRGRRTRRLPRQRSHRHLSHHSFVADGRVGGPVGVGRRAQRLGKHSPCRRNAERRRSRRSRARRPADWIAGHDLHRVAGIAADDPQHEQDCRRTDARPHSTLRRAPWRRTRFRFSAITPTSCRAAPPDGRCSARTPCRRPWTWR